MEEMSYLNTLSQVERLKKLLDEGITNIEIDKYFNLIRKLGNRAAHAEIEGELEIALTIHRNLYKITSWYIESYIDYKFVTNYYNILSAKKEENIVQKELKILIGEFKQLINHNLESENAKDIRIVKNQRNMDEICYESINKDTNYNYSNENNYEDTKIFNEEIFNNIKIEKRESPYIVYCKEELKKLLNKDIWKSEYGNRCIIITNKKFKNSITLINKQLKSKIYLQYYMKRPIDEVAFLQVEIVGGGLECKDLRLKLSDSLKSKLKEKNDILIGSKDAEIISMELPAKEIFNESDDTIVNVKNNSKDITEKLRTFIDFFNDNLVNLWCDKELILIINDFYSEDINISIKSNSDQPLKIVKKIMIC